MKRQCLIGLLLLLALSACDTTTREARRMVKRAELLADTQPDSTVSLIDSVLRMPASFSERERMDMALLQAEALFGDRSLDDDFFEAQSTLSTSPELERAADYYARKKQYAKAAKAALYSGFVQQHYNEKESTMRSFKEAEEYGKLAVDSLTVARADYLMGKLLYYYDDMEQEALNSLRISERFIGNRFDERALIENSKAVAYILTSQYDSAELSLCDSYLHAEKSGSDKVKRKIYNNYSVLYRIQGKYDKALDCLYQMLAESHLEDTERVVLYLNLGKVYFEAKEMDSVAKYYQQMESLLTNIDVEKETAASAYNALSRFAEYQNDASLAMQYRERHERVLYDLMLQRQEQTIFRTQQQYDYESLQNVMNKKIITRHLVILIISVLLLVSTIITMALQHRHKQLLRSEAEMKRQLETMKQDLQETVKSPALDQEILSRLQAIYLAYQTAQKAKDPQKEWQPLVTLIMNREQEPFEAARSVLETVYPNLYSTIRKNYPNLNETEAKVCLLSCSILSNSEMAKFLGLRPNTVNQTRSNLRKKLNLSSNDMKQLRSTLSK